MQNKLVDSFRVVCCSVFSRKTIIFPHTADLKDAGGFTIPWSFVAMLENVTMSVSHMVCLIWKFSWGGRRATFLPTQNGAPTAKVDKLLCSSIKIATFKESWILISQSNTSLRARWERYAKISNQNRNVEPKNRENLVENGYKNQ